MSRPSGETVEMDGRVIAAARALTGLWVRELDAGPRRLDKTENAGTITIFGARDTAAECTCFAISEQAPDIAAWAFPAGRMRRG